MNFLVPKATLEAILQYLGQQPYVTVANLIQAIGQCKLDPRDIKKGEAELAKKKDELKKKVVDIKKKVTPSIVRLKKAVKKAAKKDEKKST